MNKPWHASGKWIMPRIWWENIEKVSFDFSRKKTEVGFADTTLSEGEDHIGTHLYWTTRIKMAEKLASVGVKAITTPRAASYKEKAQFVKEIKNQGLNVKILAKIASVWLPLQKGWEERVQKMAGLGADILLVGLFPELPDILSDYNGNLSKRELFDSIYKLVSYSKKLHANVNFSIGDTFRHKMDTLKKIYITAKQSGANSIYLWDSRGNANPFVSYYIVSMLKKTLNGTPIFIQHHNDLGMATASSFAAALGGADMIDVSVLGLSERGGCASLEEVACSLEAYGVKTGIKLEQLYELALFVQEAFGINVQTWKPIVGKYAFTEQGEGHLEKGDPIEGPSGIAAEVVGRTYDSVIGPKLFFDRYKRFFNDYVIKLGKKLSNEQFEELYNRTLHALISRKGSLTIEEFKKIVRDL